MVRPRKPEQDAKQCETRSPWVQPWGYDALLGWCPRKAPRVKMPTAQEVASKVKDYSEGRVPAKDFFTEDVVYSEPFFKVSDVEVMTLLFGILWVLVSDVKYNVLSCFRTKEGIFVIEAEVTYVWRAPLSFKSPCTSVHFYNTVAVRPTASGGWQCTSLETVRESYMLSVPARIMTTPVIKVLTAAVHICQAVSSAFTVPA
eukprot:TRINITY_DN27680_c0_g1_i1.p1 TRINITY_DN27680_c0_g1~~TRINITY_DN27680_c0_g1_i1.p1  ORF type:complete len:201 (+),score=63.96 TRINITY_DN27680_c0_g1_i1:277-879(+)